MNEAAGNNDAPRPGSREISRSDAAQLLSIGLTDPRRPVDDLIERLAGPGGHDWLARAVGGNDLLMQAVDDDAADRPSLESLIAMKDREKDRLAEAATVDESLGALAGYCLCVGSALAIYGVLISSQSRDDWDALLVDLAEVMPPPWQDVLISAASRE